MLYKNQKSKLKEKKIRQTIEQNEKLAPCQIEKIFDLKSYMKTFL